MKLEQLHELTDSKRSGIMAALSLARVRSRRAVRGLAPGMAPAAVRTTRADLRAEKYARGGNSAYGHIYSQSVDPVEVKRRRAANRVARRSRAVNRKQS